ncbi:FliM/FliN family flagellar motor switch protein [Henriciella sp.]|uniref:FliM/FliN family flagellar motor switch protein n=1 Tax=Henriciella sp. TaxID=1968823 RepID=UPI00261D0BC3|nr:FliM/FliN family flagellar motor switch protein [Henriciella sp.]
MSAVLRKKIQLAGGLAPKILQCSPLWDGVVAGAEAWAGNAYGHELDARIISRRVISGRSTHERLEEGFSFVPLTKTSSPLAAISIDRPGAARYAAVRLNQKSESLMNASELFLKLLCEQPAHALWEAVGNALSIIGETMPPLGDIEAMPEAIEPHDRIVQVSLSLTTEGGEDGWLLEGGEEPPEIRLFFELAGLEKLARSLARQARSHAAGPAAGSQAALRSRLRQSSIRLDGVLDQFDMSIGECARLEVGQVLPLNGNETGQLALCAETMNGSVAISQGEMGNWKGQRALKLNAPVIDSFVREIAGI